MDKYIFLTAYNHICILVSFFFIIVNSSKLIKICLTPYNISTDPLIFSFSYILILNSLFLNLFKNNRQSLVIYIVIYFLSSIPHLKALLVYLLSGEKFEIDNQLETTFYYFIIYLIPFVLNLLRLKINKYVVS